MMSTVDNGLALPIVQLKLTVKFSEPFRKPTYAGSMLRGQYGRMLKRRACITQAVSCEGCMIKVTCPVIRLFEAPGHNLPPPYVIHDLQWGSCTIEPEHTWSFRHTLLGQDAIAQAPLVMHVWDKALKAGLGPDRIKGKIVSIADHLGQVAVAEDGLIPHRQPQPLRWPEQLGRKLTINIDTPLRLFFHKQQVRPASFTGEHFAKSLWMRLQALRHAPYGFDMALNLNEPVRQQLFDTRFEQINVRWRTFKRYSTRQKRKQDMSGLVGQLTIYPENEQVARLIWLGQQVHIGKNTVFGLGHYEARFSDRL